MLVNDLLVQLTRVFFVGLALITSLDFLMRRDKVRRDVALVFLSLSSSILIGLFASIIGIAAPSFGSFAVVAQPYFLLRLVRYFRPLPPLIERIALLGMFLSWGLLLLIGTPLPGWAALTIVTYFAIIDGYVIFAFVQGAFSSTSVTRNRLRFAAAGSGFLVATLLIGGIRVSLPPDISAVLLPITQFLSILSAIAYYLGFAPPRWLRQAWQLAEVRNFLQYTQNSGDKTSAEILESLCSTATRAMGATTLATVALWDETSQQLILQPTSTASLSNLHVNGIIREAWQKKLPLVVYKSSDLSVEDTRLMEAVNAETMLLAPIATQSRALGFLIVFFQYGSLFIDDDLNLLTLLASQTSIILENIAALEKLRHHAEDLEKKVTERTAELKRSNEELQQFAYVASHDLQEPLRSVISYLQLIEARYSDKLDESGHEFIAFAIEGGQRMKDLITDLLTYSRVETEARDFKWVDCQNVFNEVYKSLELTVREADAVVTHDPLPKVKGDERLLIQLFQNLIGNAIKYRSDRNPQIHVGVTSKDNQWIFSVSDNGIGIKAEYLERIFIIFQRLHNRKYPGTGIGLAICKKAVERHGGSIWAESAIGKGSTFYFTIPN